MPGRRMVMLAGALGALAVIAGAFGAHALQGKLDAKQLEWWHTATLYHLVHAPSILGAGLLAARTGGRGCAAGALFTAGVLVFSGTLYAMALGAPRWLGAITPLGGVCLIAGWVALAAAAARAEGSAVS